eukprot:Gregarina_sp_Poly_1__2575@NODE_169_length_12074_cov_67_888981_g150_i0_p2_GENE_NODE_169_length_12074_cov_67_888981_g150_i0NODE_169_length_12074_cov_67_888981_g150_i0_p2_ORF_typecomplete_len1109_score224_10SPT16/PF08644_11/1_4e41Rtt106/PF08512_12/1_1e04Rtt106/PF08512_12/4_9e03Rtt106/PF08512_12/1_7e15FACTSpt16_Nlob/PF14826_6/1_3e13Peptidase_M24/PF00557_24/2_7e05Spore_coat_CotO/PF14153_6/2_2e02Spore_coat_CotO/PF14153_6/0_015BSP_II/PF05432_11/2_4e02BSP_II/PF05432_11/0_035Mucin/PF01456_17/36Mucin/PF01
MATAAAKPAPATPPVERVVPELCAARFQRLYDSWDSLETIKDCDAILLLTGRTTQDEELICRRGLFHLWAFTLMFPETLIILFKDKRVAFSARANKLAYFQDLENTEVANRFRLEFYLRENKSQQSLLELFKSGMADSIKKCVAGDDSTKPPRVGTLLHPDSLPSSPAADILTSLLGFPKDGIKDLDAEGYNTKAETNALEEDNFHLNLRWKVIDDDIIKLCIRLDEAGKDNSRLASVAAGRMAREVVVKRVVHILDQELQEGHQDIAHRADEALDDAEKMAKWKSKSKIDSQQTDILYSLVESGGHFTLDPKTEPNQQHLHLGRGSICVGLGIKYNNNVGNIARTILMDTKSKEEGLYLAALELLTHLFNSLKPGKTFAQIYEEGMAFANEKHPLLAKHLDPCFGGALGANTLYLDGFKFEAKCTRHKLEANTAVTVVVAAPNIVCEPGKASVAVWLADSCLVPEEGQPLEVWTAGCTKKLDDILYAVEEEKENKAQTQEERPVSAKATSSENRTQGKAAGSTPGRPQPRTRARRALAGASQAEAEKLMTKQRELRRKKQEEIKERFRDGGVGFTKDKKDVRKLTHISAYRDFVEFPKDLKPNKVHLDPLRETVLIPVGQHHVPFHVSTIRNVTQQDEDGSRTHILRISFQIPGATAGTTRNEESPLPDLSSTPNALFIKEIIIRSCDQNVLNLFKNFRELLKKARTKEANRREDDVTQQQALSLNRNGRRIFLRNLMVRHTGGHSRKIIGQLEAHANGFRYSAPRCENIDLIYSNIAHAFFQPVKNEPTILLHFTLKSPIMMSKKKIKDLQFFTEAASTADDLDARRGRSTFDPDEFLEEERELERKKKLNAEFKRFVELVQETAPIEFEIPIRSLSFYGVPRNSTVVMMPTQNCLVNLSDWPVFILPIDDVEVVSFERVIHGVRHFDMIFVQKDYTKPVITVNTIPVETLDMLKSWLNDMDIVWYEGKNNLTWAAILKAVRGDITNFVEEGGFSNFLGEDSDTGRKKGDAGSDEEDDSSEEDEDEEYQESSSASDGSGSDSSSEENASDDEEEEGSESDSDEELEDEEEDEEELEDEEEEEEERSRKKRKGDSGEGGRASKKRRS